MALGHEELAEVITAWPLLSADLRQAVLAIVRSADVAEAASLATVEQPHSRTRRGGEGGRVLGRCYPAAHRTKSQQMAKGLVLSGLFVFLAARCDSLRQAAVPDFVPLWG